MDTNKSKLNIAISILLIIVIVCTWTFSAGFIGANNKQTATTNTSDNVVNTDSSVLPNTNDTAPLQLKNIYLDQISYDYQKVGYGNLQVNQGSDGNKLSLYKDGAEVTYNHGYFAHAYSTLVFEGLATRGFTKFSTYIGVNKTARVNNTATKLQFSIFVDNVLVFQSGEFGAYTNQQYVEIDITGAERLTLVADTLGSDANDHAVWADCKLYYYNQIKPELQVYDMEFANPNTVTDANLLSNAKAYSWDGSKDISGSIKYYTNYNGGVGEYDITYAVKDGNAVAVKTVKLKVLSNDRYVTNADEQYLTQPFADFVYYGRSLLSEQSRKAYDYIMEGLLKTNIADSSVTSVTFNLQDQGIFMVPSDVQTVKKYLIYDEVRLYFLYDWHFGETAGVSNTTKNGLVNTITINLNNGNNGYYKGQNNINAYKQAEKEVTSFLNKLSPDMTDAQMLHSVIKSYGPTISYANVNYADGFYGAFITKQCICSGYAKGAQYLGCRLGIRSAYVVGNTVAGFHAWNDVFLDGQWYWYDTTWSIFEFKALTTDRTETPNFAKMPKLSSSVYNINIAQYPLINIKTAYLLPMGEQLDVNELVAPTSSVTNVAPIVSASYTGEIISNAGGTYQITVKAVNSLGNVATSICEVFVYSKTEWLNSLQATQSGSSNWTKRQVSLYYGGKEQPFANGIYTKANGTITLTYDLAGNDYSYFSGYVGVDKVIRDNVNYGYYANATVKVIADGKVLFTKSNIGWKADMIYFAVPIPEGTQKLQISVTDNSGQGGVGWGDCKLYK